MPRPTLMKREDVILGQRLAALRMKAGLKQDDAALVIGRARSTVAGYERGLSTPSREALSKLAKLYNVSLDYLDRGVNVERPEQEDPASAQIGVAKVMHYWSSLNDRDKDIIISMIEVMAKKG